MSSVDTGMGGGVELDAGEPSCIVHEKARWCKVRRLRCGRGIEMTFAVVESMVVGGASFKCRG